MPAPHSTTRYNPDLPAHVSPQLVHDFDIYNPGQGERDHFEAFWNLFEIGVPDIFWTRHNGGHWIIARGEYIAEAFRDPATFSSTRMSVPDELNFERNRLIPIMIDPPDHGAYRALISPSFSPRAINAMEQEIRGLAHNLVTDLLPKGECNFIDDFALHLPIGIFMRLVDLPERHRLSLLELVDRIEHPSQEDRDDILGMIVNYLAPIIEERKRNPGNDMLSQVTQGMINGRPLTDREMQQIGALLLIGGLDSVASTMGLIAYFLAENPDHRHDLIAHPELVHNAVEELLRRFPTVTGPGRNVMKDVDFKNVTLRVGDHVIMPRPLYNFDPRLFSDPMKVDFRRPKPIHASFGTAGGPHRCPGSFLARSELAIFLEEWLGRIPDFQLKPGAAIRYDGGHNVSVRQLPLVWEVLRH